MKRILLPLMLFSASFAQADSCATGLMPLFTGPQAKEICTTFSAGTIGTLANNTYAVARNAADSANINVWKVDSSDNTVLNSSASDELVFQLDDDSNRLISSSSSSDAALFTKWGDGGTTATQIWTIEASTADADDDSTLILAGGGGTAGTRGSSITLPGEEVSGGADITYNAGTGDTHIFSVAGTAEATISDDALTFSGASAALAFGATSGLFKVNGNTELTLADDKLTFAGASAKIVPGATSLTVRDNADAVDNLKITDAGEVTMAGASLGWSYVTGANTACTTTCTFAAVFGVDLAAGASSPVIVGPSNAAADACVCAGAN